MKLIGLEKKDWTMIAGEASDITLSTVASITFSYQSGQSGSIVQCHFIQIAFSYLQMLSRI